MSLKPSEVLSEAAERGGWQPIEAAPKPHEWLKPDNTGRFLLALLREHRDEDGEPTGETTLLWAHVAYLTASGWMVSSSGFRGLHGNCSFPLYDNATHWMRLPPLALSEGQ